MIPARLVFVLPVAFGLQACAAFSGVTPTNLEPILVGAPRARVEAVLGSPSDSKPNGCGTIDTYRYNRGRKPQPGLMALGMVHPAAPLVVGLIAHPFLYYGQKGDLDVVYDPNETVIKYGPRDLRDWDSLFSNNHLWVDQTTSQDVAEHYYRIGMAETVNRNTAQNCLCQAARLGHPDSQIYLAETSGHPPGPAGGPPVLALASFETASFEPANFDAAASDGAAPSLSEMAGIETGVMPPGHDRPPPPLIPAHLIAGACAAPAPAPGPGPTQTPTKVQPAKPRSSGS